MVLSLIFDSSDVFTRTVLDFPWPKNHSQFTDNKTYFCNFNSRLSTSLREDDALGISVEHPEEQPPAVWPGEMASRRKSTLGLITEDEGFHVIKGPEHSSVSSTEQQDVEHNEQTKLSRKRSSRKERWQSVRQRTYKRKISAEIQMKQVYTEAKKFQENQTKRKESRVRSSSFPVAAENSPKTTKRNLSLGDTVPVGNDLELLTAIPKAKQADVTNGLEETRF